MGSSSDRLSSFTKNREVGGVHKQPVALSPGGLAKQAQLPHVLERLRDSRRGDTDALGCPGNRDDGIPLHVFEDSQHRSGRAAQTLDLSAVLFEQGQSPFVKLLLTKGYAIFVSLA